MNDINTFNTGRGYTAHGQRIAWCVIGRSVANGIPTTRVSFVDIDRNIDGVVSIFECERPTNRQVLRAYDRGGYTLDLNRERVASLEHAAAQNAMSLTGTGAAQ